jgi:hypothetical protein
MQIDKKRLSKFRFYYFPEFYGTARYINRSEVSFLNYNIFKPQKVYAIIFLDETPHFLDSHYFSHYF